ncbi:NUDIX hydrolase [Pseudoalteromonas sp. SMS1]|uniref:nucleotide triphosphate diphosphatase NUDT15 n=1 Tax=Pseudoalteromonas sp. SMS1 TaxID=2908894 RepID=UPI001F340E25|nr:NUDIX hydrolase [Pseudoalteromonas sp. SMS1]MCF2857037.1 NUDIX hydrolase [Pseudoalteromonas sp. SMS1]
MENVVKVGVGVILIRDGKILLGERQGAHGENTWATPGGHLEFGESVESCAAREVLEETGLHISSVRKVGFTNDIFDNEHKHYITLFVAAECPIGDAVVMEPEKCKSWRWFALDDLPKPLFLCMENFLKDRDFENVNL